MEIGGRNMLFGRKAKREKVIEPEEKRIEESQEEAKPVEAPVVESIKPEEPKVEVTQRYVYGFRAKLIVSDEVTQGYYHEVMHELHCLGIKTRESFRQVRCYIGKQPLAVLVFKGKKLSIAIALNPKDYEETKYRGIDLSEKKRYEKTPMLLKLTSLRKVSYVKHLLSVLSEEYHLTRTELPLEKEKIPSMSLNQLIANHLVKVVLGKASVSQSVDEDYEDEEDDEEEEFYVSDPVIQETPVRKKNLKNKRIGIVNLDLISKHFEAHETISISVLKEKGLVSDKMNCLKVLARGNVDKPFVVEADLFSAEAKHKIYAAGGTIKLV